MSEYGVVSAPGAVRFERLLPGPIERVWSYLTESEERGTWLAKGQMDLRVGGRVELVFHNSELTGHDDPPPAKYARYGAEARAHGRITACEPPRLLAFTWDEESGEDSEVRFELEERAEKVLLIVTHERLASRGELISVAGGWHTHLGILADRLTGRPPAGFWATHTRLEADYEHRIPAGGRTPDREPGRAGPSD